ncbi:DNA excision repair protein ERCC 6 [Elysia marginata]|uniref:DNA excision repair protein ERCC 6 n=1 Tax=Elysia marginata TaxID=1093978 RepID=A0AAV4EIU0_9GAST|nr:DNA excision repair protein ERCC 6 [Elysia marginata]
MLHSSFNCLQRLRWKKHHFNIEVPQNYYVFEDVSNPKDMPQQQHHGGNNNAFTNPQQSGMSVVGNTGKNAESVTIDTQFKNDTEREQTYKFRFEKNRRQEMTVSFQKGFTFGTETHFKVGLPQIFGGDTELEFGANTEYQVTNSKGQTFEESVVMEATSDITVARNSCYVADVKLEDLRVMKPFRSTTRMRIPEGYAPVYIKRKSDGKQVFVYVVRNLKDVFGHCASVKTSTAAAPGVDGAPPPRYDGTWLDFITEGYVEGTFVSKHQILLRNVSDPTEGVGDQE